MFGLEIEVNSIYGSFTGILKTIPLHYGLERKNVCEVVQLLEVVEYEK